MIKVEWVSVGAMFVAGLIVARRLHRHAELGSRGLCLTATKGETAAHQGGE